MQGLGPALRLNHKHPDAKQCVGAWTLGERTSATSVRQWFNLAQMGTNLRTRMQDTTPAAVQSATAMRHGLGHFVNGASNSFALTTTETLAAPSAGWSWMIQANQDVTGGFAREWFELWGFIFMSEIARTISFYNTGGTLLANSTSTITLGLEYSLGIRYTPLGGGVVSFFINGKREDVGAIGTLTPSATALFTTGGGFRNPNSGAIRDIRIFNAPLPDSAFQRYYRDPNSFYHVVPPFFLRKSSLNGGMFFPFFR